MKKLYNIRFTNLSHGRAMACAKAKGLSLNAYILMAVEKAVERDQHLLQPENIEAIESYGRPQVERGAASVVWIDGKDE